MKHVDIITGYSCNMNCSFCMGNPSKRNVNYSFNQLKSSIIDFRKQGYESVCLNGGEPTIRKCLIDLVKLANYIGFKKIKIQTNGIMFSKKDFLDKIEKAGVNSIGITFSSAKKTDYEQDTDFHGSFELLLNALENLKKSKIEIEIDIIITKSNYHSLKNIAEFLLGYNVKKINLKFVGIGGNAKLNASKIVPNINEISPSLKECLDFCSQKNIKCSVEYFPHCIIKEHSDKMINIEKTEISIIEGKKSFDFKENLKNDYFKPEACRKCSVNKKCPGISKEYTKIYNDFKANPFECIEYDLSESVFPEHFNKNERKMSKLVPKKQDEIINEWNKYFSQENKVPLALYVHIPFCKNKCSYCHCTSFTKTAFLEEYLKALSNEIKSFKEIIQIKKFDSLYIGGGSPNIISSEQLNELLSIIFKNAHFKEICQKTIELNPNILKPEILEVIMKYPIDRISIGIQSLNKKVLHSINRFQNPEESINAATLIKKTGKILNIDIMTGLPEETNNSVFETVKAIAALKPDTIHFYVYDKLVNEAENNSKEAMKKVKQAVSRIENSKKYISEYSQQNIGNVFFKNKNKINKYDLDMTDKNASIIGFGFGAKSHIFGRINYIISEFQDYLQMFSKQKQGNYVCFPMNKEEEEKQKKHMQLKMCIPKKLAKIIFENE